MYESNWGRSAAARGKNLGGITGKGPEGATGNFRKYKEFPQFYRDYTGLICNAPRYKDAVGKKGQAYVDALKKAGYDATDPNYGDNVMKIYKQLGCK
jgi:flagellum-specific peptidoglycan hydrolase FlgJ